MIRCPRCGTELPDGVSFCDHCGAPVRGQMPQANPVFQPFDNQASAEAPTMQGAAPAPVVTTCPVCGATVIPGEAFCDNCGASLLAAIPTAPPVSSPPVYQPAAPAAAPYQPQSQVTYQPAPASAPAQPMVSTPPPAVAPGVGRLVVLNTRAEVPLPPRNELIVGREDQQSNSYPDVDLNPHGGLEQGVSRRHLRITRRGNQYYVEDLNTTNGTLVNQRRISPHTMTPIKNGDQLMLGRLGLLFEQG